MGTRKDWYVVKAPANFLNRECGRTIVNRTAGLKTSTDSLKGRVFEVSLADLNSDEDQFFRKMKLCVEDIQGTQVLTNFHGMDFTRDKLGSLVKKWHTLIEAWVDVKTIDGYTLRLFCIGFTKRHRSQDRKTSYAQASQVRNIRGKEVEKACNSIYPLQDVFIRKAKVLKKPKFDLAKLMEVHEDVEGEVEGRKVKRD